MKLFERFIFLVLCALNIQQGQRCRLNTRVNFGEPLPVIIRNGRLLEPTDEFGNIELDFGETITLSCGAADYIRHPNTIRDVRTATVACDGAETFKNEDWLSFPAQFNLFKCSYAPNYSSKRTNRTCYDRHNIFEVGYQVEDRFYSVFESCFNELTLTPIYSTYTQKPYNANYQTRVERPFFIKNDLSIDIFGPIPVETLYSPKGLKSAVAQLVGPMTGSYITDVHYLSRGHLAAKTDFVLAFGERATFHYVNCAPQWYGFNGGNWNTLEIDLRNHIHLAGYHTTVYTGTFGVMSLFNNNGRKVDIYLYTDENSNPVIPIPNYFYKVVYEPSTRRGIAFVGINNPFLSEKEAEELIFCKDYCRGNSQFSWLTWHPTNAYEGYAFCCNIPDFKRTVDHLPDFAVKELLT